MKKVLLYGLVLCVIILGILIGVIVIRSKEDEKVFGEDSDIIINQVTNYEEIANDSDVRIISSICDCVRGGHLGYKLPDDIKFINDYGIFIKDSEGNYSVLHDEVFEFSNSKDRWVNIMYSLIEEPLKDYVMASKREISSINGVNVIIYQYENMFMVDFQYKDKYYNIQTSNISKDELISLIKGILK